MYLFCSLTQDASSGGVRGGGIPGGLLLEHPSFHPTYRHALCRRCSHLPSYQARIWVLPVLSSASRRNNMEVPRIRQLVSRPGPAEAGADRVDMAGSQQRAYKGCFLAEASSSRAGHPFPPFLFSFTAFNPGTSGGSLFVCFSLFALFLQDFPRLRGSQQCIYRQARHGSGTAAVSFGYICRLFLFSPLCFGILHSFLLSVMVH